MDITTKKRLEEQLRQLIREADASPPSAERRPSAEKSRAVQVIRRRKRMPARKVA